MGEVTLVPAFQIGPGRTEDFRIAAAKVIERVKGEPDTLRYDQYLSDDGTRAINIEVFRDADAFVYHNRNVADLVAALFDAGSVVHLDVIGETNDAMRDELAFAAAAWLMPLGSIGR